MRGVWFAVALALVASACSDGPLPTQPNRPATSLTPGSVLGSEAPGPRERVLSRGLAATAGTDNLSSDITYHGGLVEKQLKTAAIYWATTPIYNNEPTPGTTGNGSGDASLIGYFLNHLGGSTWFSTNMTYSDNTGDTVHNVLSYTQYWANNQNVPPSDGSTVSNATIQSMITGGLQSGKLTYDPQTVYLVFTAGHTNLGGDFAPNGYCAYHLAYQAPEFGTVLYAAMPYANYFPDGCTSNDGNGPNSDIAADAEVNLVAHELSESATDPLANAWYDQYGQENADKCVWLFGKTQGAEYNSGSGVANTTIGTKNFLVQLLWINQPGVGCVLGYIHYGFYPTLMVGAPKPITSAGTYTFSIDGTSVAPSGTAQYQWSISSSNGVIPAINTGYQGDSYALSVPAGSYSIYLTVTPKDFAGVGFPTQFTYPVCTTTGGSAAVKGASPYTLGGCH